jgi:hypothetical protein
MQCGEPRQAELELDDPRLMRWVREGKKSKKTLITQEWSRDLFQ